MRVSLYGNGQVNRGVAEILATRSGYEVAGPYGRGDRERGLCSGADIVVVATTSFLADIADDVADAIKAGSNVITTAEEAALPATVDPSLAAELDRLARAHGVSGLGCGLNPGLAFDSLVLTAAGVAWDVTGIRVQRAVDLSRFSATILRRLGIGYDPDDFASGVERGTVHGHIGFPQSMRVVADALGVALERIERRIEPIFGEREYVTPGMSIRAGTTAGFRQQYVGVVDDRPWFEAVFTGHVNPPDAGVLPRDEIDVRGAVPVHVVIEPGFDPQTGSSGMIANSLRRVVTARPGWLTVADLPPAHPY